MTIYMYAHTLQHWHAHAYEMTSAAKFAFPQPENFLPSEKQK